MLEREVQRKSVAAAKRAGWWARKFQSQGKRSAPDYFFAKKGRVFFCEFKATDGRPSELQLLEHEKMREAGLTVYVCDDPYVFIQDILQTEERLAKAI